jgi:hypothetical protein
MFSPSDYTFYGGPIDGSEVPRNLTRQDYILIETGNDNDNVVTYYYVKCDQHPWFEYAGEVEEE